VDENLIACCFRSVFSILGKLFKTVLIPAFQNYFYRLFYGLYRLVLLFIYSEVLMGSKTLHWFQYETQFVSANCSVVWKCCSRYLLFNKCTV